MPSDPYHVVQAHTMPELVKAVNGLIRDGYQPAGGIAVEANTTLTFNYYQAVFKPPK